MAPDGNHLVIPKRVASGADVAGYAAAPTPSDERCAVTIAKSSAEAPTREVTGFDSARPVPALRGRLVAVRHLGRFRSCAVVALLVVGLLAGGCSSSKKASSVSAGSATSSGVTASGNSTAVKNVRAPKTKFVLHAGLAFGAFHRYLYKPFKAGTFKAHAHGRLRAAVKGGLAGLFVYHELKLALTDAQADKTLSKLVAPITALQDRIRSSAAGVKSGKTQDLEGTNTQLEQLRSQSAQAGAPVQDQQTNSLATTGQ